jgi:hypothetical protein
MDTRRYVCAHCLRELAVLEDDTIEHCPDHPDGAIEWVSEGPVDAPE